MLSRLPVARKDAILLFIAGILMLVLAFYNNQSRALAMCIAIIAITRGVYKWTTSPTIDTQVTVPIFK
jgi:hypothetical protein